MVRWERMMVPGGLSGWSVFSNSLCSLEVDVDVAPEQLVPLALGSSD